MNKKTGFIKQVPILDEEVTMGDEEFIVSKTDKKGHVVYANRVFMEMSLLTEDQLLNQNHNIIRHPDMPKGVFQYAWHNIKKGKEFFGFVKNLRSDGRYYWVFANITPEYDGRGKLIGYMSVRRKPPTTAIDYIKPLYHAMLTLEKQANSDKEAIAASLAYLEAQLAQRNCDYQEMVISLFKGEANDVNH